MKLGDTLKVYCRATTNGYNLNLVQLEKDGKVLEDYSKSESTKEGLLLFLELFGTGRLNLLLQ